jgi:hypothetical protein
MSGWLSRIFVDKVRTFPETGYRYQHKDCTYIMLCMWNRSLELDTVGLDYCKVAERQYTRQSRS